MNRICKKFSAILCCGAILLCGCDGGRAEVTDTVTATDFPVAEEPAETTPPIPERKLASSHFDADGFNLHISMAEVYAADEEILCGTVPHHILAGRLIAGFLKTAAVSREKTDTVVIVGTMHYTKDSPLCTSLKSWDTPFGVLECDRELTEKIIDVTGAETDDDMAEQDHAVAALVPYVKYYFPDSEIAFLLVDNKAAEDTPQRLAEMLMEMSGEKNCLFVFSADFSHYLDPWDTEMRDNETLSAVMASDYERIGAMTDDNVDSPHVLGTFMRLSEAAGREISLLDHSNSLLISGVPYNERTYSEGLTSYFVFGA